MIKIISFDNKSNYRNEFTNKTSHSTSTCPIVDRLTLSLLTFRSVITMSSDTRTVTNTNKAFYEHLVGDTNTSEQRDVYRDTKLETRVYRLSQ